MKRLGVAMMGLVIVLLVIVPTPVSAIQANLGWIALTRFLYSQEAASAELAQAYFEQALARTQRKDANTGKALLALIVGPHSPARYAQTWASDDLNAEWQVEGVDGARLVAVGEWLFANGRHDQALNLFAAIFVSDFPFRSEAWTAIGRICRQARFPGQKPDLEIADQVFSGKVFNESDFAPVCSAYWTQAGQNLIVNGDFAVGHLRSWSRRHQSGIQYLVSPGDIDAHVHERTGERAETFALGGVDGLQEHYAVEITSRNRQSYGGIFQSVHLPPGVRVRFSAWLKVQAEPGAIHISPLYVRVEQEDGYWRRSLAAINESIEWSYLENTYTIPADHDTATTFYPVFFRGVGTIWIDHVVVELVD